MKNNKFILSIILIGSIMVVTCFDSNSLGDLPDKRFEGTWEASFIMKPIMNDHQGPGAFFRSTISFANNNFIVAKGLAWNKFSGRYTFMADTLILLITHRCSKRYHEKQKDTIECLEYDLIQKLKYKLFGKDSLKLSIPFYSEKIEGLNAVQTKSLIWRNHTGHWRYNPERVYHKVEDSILNK